MSAFEGSREALKAEVIRLLEAELAAAAQAHAATEAGATHEEAKPENDKDTRALEQSYLARGQAARVSDLRTAVGQAHQIPTRSAENAPVALGAIIDVEEDDGASVFFMAPGAGGAKIAEGRVQVVTPASPLGRALLGKRAGDDVEVRIGPRARALSVVRVR